MKRRDVLRSGAALAGAAAFGAGAAGCTAKGSGDRGAPRAAEAAAAAESFAPGKAPAPFPITYPFTLPPLGYAYEALEPHVDTATMRVHHDKHHKTYVDGLNKALERHPGLHRTDLRHLVADVSALPEDVRTPVRNHGGGHLNHTYFWESMRPGGRSKAPSESFEKAIVRSFGSVDRMKEAFDAAGADLFGSGWVHLVAEPSLLGLRVVTTANQDSLFAVPGRRPILSNDCWEHAFYLKHQNKKADYLKAWWNVVSWDVASARWEDVVKEHTAGTPSPTAV